MAKFHWNRPQLLHSNIFFQVTIYRSRIVLLWFQIRISVGMHTLLIEVFRPVPLRRKCRDSTSELWHYRFLPHPFSSLFTTHLTRSGMWRRVVCWVATDVSEEHIASIFTCLLAGSCWNYFFDPEDGGDMFLRNVGCKSTDYTTSHPRRWYSSIIQSFVIM
jgi:hypothetical protein